MRYPPGAERYRIQERPAVCCQLQALDPLPGLLLEPTSHEVGWLGFQNQPVQGESDEILHEDP